MSHAILLISCKDQKSITAAVTNFISQHAGNILHADQHIDENTNTFFMRVEWDLDGFQIERDRVAKEFSLIANRFDMCWGIHFTDILDRLAIFVSKPLHCLYDLLYRYSVGQLCCQIPVIISNHQDAKKVANQFSIPFFCINKDVTDKEKKESQELEILQENHINGIVLARYHQILSKNFVDQYPHQIINIHHSFLPAFAGKNPYTQAYEKGVKIIGATSHYVIEELDQGPIIEQDTVRISHRDSVDDLRHKGEDLEKVVLYRAVRWHLERKILAYENKTVVFD